MKDREMIRMIKKDKEIEDIKKAIFFLYESIRVGSFHPDLKEIVDEFEEKLQKHKEGKE